MIIIVHHKYKTTQVMDAKMQTITRIAIGNSITQTIYDVSTTFPDVLIVWCDADYLDVLDVNAIPSLFHHRRILASYNPNANFYLQKQIGYVERSFYVKVNKKVTYPTWMMSSCVGGVHASVINTLSNDLKFDINFDYFINSLAKRAMVEGLFCYSEPKLLRGNFSATAEIKQGSIYETFKFVKQHYKWVWVFFLSLAYLVYEKKITLLPLIKSLFFKQLSTTFNLEAIPIQSTKTVITKHEIDVIIPTIGRKQYLYDVLKDLAAQTLLPKNVIIVEQNPLEGSVSELNYLNNQEWPFTIKHTFTQQLGVCNARNIALNQIESEWVFFADDDIRFNNVFFEESIKQIDVHGISVLIYSCLQPEQNQTHFNIHQTTVFGSGSSMVKSSVLNDLSFNIAYENGFGEDTEFGMQIRYTGHDVVFVPEIKIIHLKAPIGGYRTKVNHPWSEDTIVPKPSPTIQLLYQTYFTPEQLLGYKLLLGLRSYKNSDIKNPWTYITHYNKQWKRSQFWSYKLQQNPNA